MTTYSEADFKRIIRELHEAELDRLMAREQSSEPVLPSSEMRERLERLAIRTERQAKMLRFRRAVLGTAAAVLLVFCILRPQTVAEAFRGVMEWFADHVRFHSEKDVGEVKIPRYTLGYVPEGYELAESVYDENIGGTMVYTNGERMFVFDTGLSDAVISMDLERHTLRLLYTEDGETLYFLERESAEEDNIVLWFSDDERQMFDLTGDFSLEELLEIRSNILEIDS